jgi:hypothetical protein
MRARKTLSALALTGLLTALATTHPIAFWTQRRAEIRLAQATALVEELAADRRADELAAAIEEEDRAAREVDRLEAEEAWRETPAPVHDDPADSQREVVLISSEHALRAAARDFRAGMYDHVAVPRALPPSQRPPETGGLAELRRAAPRASLTARAARVLADEASARLLSEAVLPVTVSVEDADIRDVMDEISRRIGRRIVVEPDVHEKVTLSLHQIPWRELIRVIANLTRCEIDGRDGAIVLYQPSGVRISCNPPMPVRTTLELLAPRGLQIVMSADVGGETRYPDMSRPIDGIAVVASACHLHVRRKGDTLLVTTRPVAWGSPFVSVEGE